MIQPWIVLAVATTYLCVLFAVASYGDRTVGAQRGLSRPNIYAFSLAIYCTTWTFFGSVGLATRSGLDFLAIYAGPILAITIGFPVIQRVIELSKEERITSVADFLGARYGKNLKVAGVAAVIAVIGTVPYIALQLKAISSSVSTLIFDFDDQIAFQFPAIGDISILIALTLALFAILFGTRHADATEHQHGLMLAIAMESVVKLIAFLCVGAFVTFVMFDGVQDLFSQARQDPNVQEILNRGFDGGNFAILTFLSLIVFLLLPRQFHVAVVENNSQAELNRARWLFPLYLIAINLFVIPVALAGALKFGTSVNADDFVLLLPLESSGLVSLFAFIGGLSAGTAMVVVACVALAIMISNDLVLPLFLRSRASAGHAEPENMEDRILNIRRTSILVVLALSYIYYKAADNSAALASIGLVSFAAIAQLAPAFFGGLMWKRATATGAMLGMLIGFVIWAYTLFLPTLVAADSALMVGGLFGWEWLRPQALFETRLSPIANGVIWSLTFNTFAFVFGSMIKVPEARERLQAALFVPSQSPTGKSSNIGKSTVSVGQLKATVSRYLGTVRTDRAFEAFWATRQERPDANANVDNELLTYSEQLLASAIGASSSRLVHTLLLKRFDRSAKSNIRLLDDASKALQFNRDVLQTALEQLEQGIAVFDRDFRLASWNRQFRNLLGLPDRIGQAGIPLSDIAEEISHINKLEEPGEWLASRLIEPGDSWQLILPESQEVLEIRTSPMPDGGVVVTWHNITERVEAAKALEEANEFLEKRVEERTQELEQATIMADQANASKTRFLAAAGHDLLQPLNAARLYASTLTERIEDDQERQLAENVGKSLGSVEEILGAILAISRLDTATPEVSRGAFPLRNITEQLELEFEPVAEEKGLQLAFVHSSAWVHSDRALLRRLLQNLISNAIKFTRSGKVLVGCRKRGERLLLEIYDTGIGMSRNQQKLAFGEFTRLEAGKRQAPGLGLGLSIVERIAGLLDLEVAVDSEPGKGTKFTIVMPLSKPQTAADRQKSVRRRAAPGQLTGTRILCVDNEPAILDGMAALIGQWGCTVSTATGESSALGELSAADALPDILLVDYHLDNTTGINLVNRLRDEFDYPFPAILITADYTKEVKGLAEKHGLAILNKPIKPAALRAMISREKLARQAAE